ncbi:hypothetical protein [Nevskia ramosa]|uniref:hypothetical protein n=1 Tax=Nevskia ramosa TaxID=64002 RepID=UPI003D122FA9
MNLPSLTPGFIVSYDAASKTARVSIPGLTDGDEYPEAEFNYPIGDKSEHTDIRTLPSDRVWLAFVNGDKRYPIIMGFRPKQVGNVVGTRRFHHDNIETDADQTQTHTAGTRMEFRCGNSSLVLTPNAATLTTPHFVVNAAESDFNGEVDVSGSVEAAGDVKAGLISLTTHLHGGVQAGGSQTTAPLPT